MPVNNVKLGKILLKLDPDKELSQKGREVISKLSIDQIVIGGTQNITVENSNALYRLIRDLGYRGQVLQELSAPEAIIFGAEGYLVPVALNSGSLYWLRDAHLNAIRKYGAIIPWDRVLVEGYLVCNSDSAVARVTEGSCENAEEAAAYLRLAEKIYRLPVFYIEYSGRYGDEDLVRAVSQARESIHLVYGGGITNPEQAAAMLKLVDTVVIGNLIYDAPEQLLEIILRLGTGCC